LNSAGIASWANLMFPSLRLEVMERFTAAEQYFRNSPKGLTQPRELTQTAKGLAFVQIYAIYEYTVREVTRNAIIEIATHGHRFSDLKSNLLAIFLDPQMKSLRDCTDKDVWKRRLEMLEQAMSNEPITAVIAIPHDGSHFRHTQVELILQMLGVRRTLTLRRKHLYQIDEIVENRNAIAHGNDTAADVGKRYSRADVQQKSRLMQKICLRLIEIVSEHCSRSDQHVT
jgi:hypothetical protein